MARITLGSRKEMADPEFAPSVLAELLLTFLFVFVGVAASMTAGNITRLDHGADGGGGGSGDAGCGDGSRRPRRLGGALEPRRHYRVRGRWLRHRLPLRPLRDRPAAGLLHGLPPPPVHHRRAGEFACRLPLPPARTTELTPASAVAQDIPVHALGAGIGPLQGAIMEVILTFCMVFSIYAIIVDPKKGIVPVLAPLLIGFIVGANTLAGGPFSGASMNPARSFGPALATWDWTNHWVYWAGPLVGSGLAGFVYDHLYLMRPHDDLPGDEESITKPLF
ncbi:hypothetical protein BHM03_00056392 [Ensete ventricosum]|nr:hypothetical protein BHM03_00056392 [Ensete ventricosum]